MPVPFPSIILLGVFTHKVATPLVSRWVQEHSAFFDRNLIFVGGPWNAEEVYRLRNRRGLNVPGAFSAGVEDLLDPGRDSSSEPLPTVQQPLYCWDKKNLMGCAQNYVNDYGYLVSLLRRIVSRSRSRSSADSTTNATEAHQGTRNGEGTVTNPGNRVPVDLATALPPDFDLSKISGVLAIHDDMLMNIPRLNELLSGDGSDGTASGKTAYNQIVSTFDCPGSGNGTDSDSEDSIHGGAHAISTFDGTQTSGGADTQVLKGWVQWYHSAMGVPAMQKAVQALTSSSGPGGLTWNDVSHEIPIGPGPAGSNVRELRWFAGRPDFFFLPTQAFSDFARFAGWLARHFVFPEIVFPTTACWLQNRLNSVKVKKLPESDSGPVSDSAPKSSKSESVVTMSAERSLICNAKRDSTQMQGAGERGKNEMTLIAQCLARMRKDRYLSLCHPVKIGRNYTTWRTLFQRFSTTTTSDSEIQTDSEEVGD